MSRKEQGKWGVGKGVDEVGKGWLMKQERGGEGIKGKMNVR